MKIREVDHEEISTDIDSFTTVDLDFDIQKFKGVNDYGHHSNFKGQTGNTLDTFEVICGSGVHLMHGKLTPGGKGRIRIMAESDYVQFTFLIDCPRTYSLSERAGVTQKVEKLFQTAFFVRAGTYLSFHWEELKMNEVFEISISAEYLLQLLPEEHFLHRSVMGAISGGRSSYLFNSPMPISPKLKSELYALVYCQHKGVARSMFTKGKLIEIFALQQSKHEKMAHGRKTSTTLPYGERQRMFRLREYLSRNLEQNPSLNELAKNFGTNECYLKRNFKREFGTTVYGYLKQARMEKARKLLLQKDKKVSEIAHILGYRYANHFTTAFKRHYGYRPNDLI